MTRVASKAPARGRRGLRRKTPEHRTPRKDEILEEAARLFAERGYEAVSLLEIAQAVGLSKTTLYHYFASKDEILGTLIATTISQLNEFIAAEIPAEGSPAVKLTAFMEAQAEFFERHIPQFKVLLSQIGNLTDPVARDAAVAWRERYSNNIRRIVEEGVGSGAFASVHPSAVVRTVLGSIYWLARWYQPGGSRSARQIAREYADLILYGFAQRPAHRSGSR
jgi:AcrR family transcriptional regulator